MRLSAVVSLILVLVVLVNSRSVPEPEPGCPRIDGLYGICVEECSHHRPCAPGLRCCFNGCGHVCMKPAHPYHPRPNPYHPRPNPYHRRPKWCRFCHHHSRSPRIWGLCRRFGHLCRWY